MADQRGKTIKQIADELGVSKQTVYKRYKGKLHTVVAPYVYTEQGVLYVLEQGETLIKSDFSEDDRSNGAYTGAHTEHSNGAPENQALYAILKEELAAKNAQIEKLQADLEEERKHSREMSDKLAQLADQAQKLHAGTIQQQLPEGSEEAAAGVEIDAAEQDEPSFWGRVKYIFTGK